MITEAFSEPDARLAFIVAPAFVPSFFLLLQQGVKIRSRVGRTVEEFLREELEAGPATIEKIQSIVLDGKPVDDIRSARVHAGSVLALSAAMPGLVGATLRRGGAYSSFRRGITYQETGEACESEVAWVGIKIFNLLMAELGPGLLKKGVLVRGADLVDFLAGRAADLRPGIRSSTLDGQTVCAAALGDAKVWLNADQVLLTVEAGPAEE